MKTDFYKVLGIETPKEPSFENFSLALHDLLDHGISPYEGFYIPVTFKGEVLAHCNNLGRDCAIKVVLKKRSYLSKQYLGRHLWNSLRTFAENFPVVESQDDVELLKSVNLRSELELLNKKEINIFFKKCFIFWCEKPDLELFLDE